MRVAIDYDETYTRLPALWDAFCQSVLDAGGEVFCVSARSDQQMLETHHTIGRVIGAENCIGTNGQPKRDYMYSKCDQVIDVWIDDNPDSIVFVPLLKGLSTDYGDFSDM